MFRSSTILANFFVRLMWALYVQGVVVKKFFKYLGFGFLSVIVFFIGIGIVTSINTVDKEVVFEPYIAKAIPKLTSWEQSSYQELMSEEGFNGATPEQWTLYLNKFSKLGEFQSIGKAELKNWKTLSPIGSPSVTYAIYQVPVTFSTGLAHVQLALQSSEDKVEINSVKFLSDILMQ